jgi:hypothetical protein
VQQAVATQEVEKVAESHQALVAVVARHLVVADHAKADLAVGLFVNQMHVVVHLLRKVLVENKSKVAKQFVNYSLVNVEK